MLYSRSRMPWRIALYVLLGLFCLFAVYGWARSSDTDGGIEVHGRAQLLEAIGKAKGGVTLRLAPGDYGMVNLTSIGRQLRANERITIMSADPCNQARFARLNIVDSANLILRDLRFQNTGFFAQPTNRTRRPNGSLQYMDLLRTERSSSLAIVNNVFVGATVAVPGKHPLNGFAHGIGWMGENVRDVQFRSNRMSNLFKGLSVRNARGLVIGGNAITDYRTDAVFVWDVADLTIEDNSFTNPRPLILAKGRGDHPDFIQLKNVVGGVIANNYMVVAPQGGASQGIFPGPARNLKVRNNIIVSRMLNGIYFRDIADSEIAGNLVLRAEDPPDGLLGRDGSRLPDVGPRIRIDPASRNLLMRGNAVSADRRRGQGGRANEIAVSQITSARPFQRVGANGARTAAGSGYRRIGDLLITLDSLATAGIDADKFAFLDAEQPGGTARCARSR